MVTGMLANDFALLDGVINTDIFDPGVSIPKGLVGYTPVKSVTWYFCQVCGSHIFQSCRREDQEGSLTKYKWYLSTGTLYPLQVDDGEHVYERKHHIWVRPARDLGGLARYLANDGLPRYKTHHIGPDTLLPVEAADRDNPMPGVEPGSTLEKKIRDAVEADHLPLRCRCGHVQLKLRRPNHHALDPRWQQKSKNNGQSWAWTFCFCNSCRTTSGYEHTAFLFCPYSYVEQASDPRGLVDGHNIPVQDVDKQTLEGDSRYPVTTGLRTYNSSEYVRRRFCPYCGACVFLDCTDRGDLVDVYLGLVDAPLRAMFDSWISPIPKLIYFGFARNKVTAEAIRSNYSPDDPCELTEQILKIADDYPGELVLGNG